MKLILMYKSVMDLVYLDEGESSEIYVSNNRVYKIHEDEDVFYNEWHIINELKEKKYPYLLTYYDIDSTHEEELTMIMEYLPHTLETCIVNNSLKNKRSVIRQILQCLHELHECGVCHDDFKAKNILLTDKEEVKVIDFGYSKIDMNMSEKKKCKLGDLKMCKFILLQILYDISYRKSWKSMTNIWRE